MVSDALRKVWQRTTVIQVKVSYEHAVDVRGEVEALLHEALVVAAAASSSPSVGETDQVGEVGELLLADHVQAAVEHQTTAAQLHYHTTPAHVLACTQWNHLNCHF